MRLLITTLALVSLTGSAVASPEDEVRASFERYRKAVQARQGSVAAREVDESTRRYYDKLRATALSAPDIHPLALSDKIMVLRLRIELSPALLHDLDGRGLIAYAVDKGWVSGEQIGSATLGKITVSGSRAEAPLIMGKQTGRAPFVFHKEKDGWRVDLTAFNATTTRELKAVAKQQKLTEDQLVMNLLQQLLGRAVPEKVWQPLEAPGRR